METNLLNREAIKDLMKNCISKNHQYDAPGIIMMHIGEELQQILAENAKSVSTSEWSDLTEYAHLKPSDDQIRRALDLLMQEKAKRGKRPMLFFCPRQWLAVFKVLVFLGLKQEGHGSMAAMENYIHLLYIGHEAPRVVCNLDALSKKNLVSPFNRSLTEWEDNRAKPELRDYWPVALTLLQHLRNVCEADLKAQSEPAAEPVNDIESKYGNLLDRF